MISDEEIADVQKRFPGLSRKDDDTLHGSVEMFAAFEGRELREEFEIEIFVHPGRAAAIPKLRLPRVRLHEIATKQDVMDLRQIHYNVTDDCACVCVKQEERERFPVGSSIVNFMDALGTPYLYSLTYFREYGQWPWAEHSHGFWGVLEHEANQHRVITEAILWEIASVANADQTAGPIRSQLRRLSENRQCPCGSDKPFRRCHSEAWQGIVQIHRAMKRLKLDPKGVFQP